MQQVLSIAIVVGLIGALLYILRNPQWSIVLVILMWPLEQLLQAYVPYLAANQWLTNVAIGLTVLFSAIATFFRGRPIFAGTFNGATIGTLGVFAIAMMGIMWTPQRGYATEMMIRAFPYYMLMLVLAPLLLHDLEDFRRIILPVLIGGAIIAILILISPKTSYHGAGRLAIDVGMQSGKLGNILALGSMGGVMVIIAALYRTGQVSPFVMLIRVVAFVSGFGLAVGSGSRGQVLGAVLIGVVFFPLARRLANPKQFILNMIGLGIVAAGFLITMRLFIGEENRDRWDIAGMFDDSIGRFNAVVTVLRPWFRDPVHILMGLGPAAYNTHQSVGSSTYVHNLPVEVLTEEGLVGFAFLLLLLVTTYRASRAMWSAHRHDPVYRSTVATFAAMAAYTFFLSLKQGSFIHFPDVMMWCMLLTKVSNTEMQLIHSGEIVPMGPDEFAIEMEDISEEGDEEYGESAVAPAS